jgi:hypothetical protein
VADLAQNYAEALSQNPFLSLSPFILSDFGVILQEQRFYAIDQQRHFLPLSNQEEKNWKLLALSGGQAIAFFAEWDGQVLNPLSLIQSSAVTKL